MSGSPKVPPEVATLKPQREQAMACLWLALTISAAAFLSVFGSKPEIASARAAVAAHRRILAEVEDVLKVNQSVLRDGEAALAERKETVP